MAQLAEKIRQGLVEVFITHAFLHFHHTCSEMIMFEAVIWGFQDALCLFILTTIFLEIKTEPLQPNQKIVHK